MCNSSLLLNRFYSIYCRTHLWWISLLEWGFLALERTSQGMKNSWIKPFSFKGHLEEKSYKKKEGNWGAARLCDSGIRDKRVTAGGGPGQSRGVTFHLGMVEDVRRTLGFSSDAETRGCSSLSPLSSPSSEAVLPESSCETELKKDWNESTSNASRKAETKAALSDPLAALLHPSLSRGTWKGGIPPLPVSPPSPLLPAHPFCSFTTELALHNLFHLVLPDPGALEVPLLLLLRIQGFCTIKLINISIAIDDDLSIALEILHPSLFSAFHYL